MADKLYRIRIDADNMYGVYTMAVIQCESEVVLRKLIDDGVFQKCSHDSVDRSFAGFWIESYQPIRTIELVGTAANPQQSGKIATIICSDYKSA